MSSIVIMLTELPILEFMLGKSSIHTAWKHDDLIYVVIRLCKDEVIVVVIVIAVISIGEFKVQLFIVSCFLCRTLSAN